MNRTTAPLTSLATKVITVCGKILKKCAVVPVYQSWSFKLHRRGKGNGTEKWAE